MDIMTGLAAIGQGLDAVQKLREIEKNFDAAAFRLEIANLTVALADARVALAEAKEALSAKDEEISSLKKVKSGMLPVVMHRGFHFGIGPDGASIGRPFCPVCEKTSGAQIQLTGGPGLYDLCPKCKAPYHRRDYPYRLPDGFDTSGAA